MEIYEKNGQPSMEEILASIRRIIAEEPIGSSPLIDLRARAKPALLASLIDEQSEFELPAIFRPSAHPAPEKHTPLFGRLTDAIRNASAAVVEVKQSRALEEPYAEPHAVSPSQAAIVQGWTPPNEGPLPHHDFELSSLSIPRDDPQFAQPHEQQRPDLGYAPQQAAPSQGLPNQAFQSQPFQSQPFQNQGGPPAAEPNSVAGTVSEWWNGRQPSPAAPAAAPSDDVKRVMVPFKDTRMVMMGTAVPASAIESQPPHAALPAGEAVAGPAAPVDFGSIVPARMMTPVMPQTDTRGWPEPAPPPVAPFPKMEAELYRTSGPASESHPRRADEVYASETARELVAQQMPVPAPHAQQAASGGVEDATADLLRPMLRQWLAENMPRMVEKALHIEVAESVRTGKKPGAV